MRRLVFALTPLLVGAALPAFAQPHRGEPHGGPPQQHAGPPPQQQHMAPPPQQQHGAPPPQGGWRGQPPQQGGLRGEPPPQQRAAPPAHYAPPQRPPAEARAWHSQGGWRQQGAWQQHNDWGGHRSTNWQSDHRGWAQRGGYGGRYIPPSRFSVRFGAPHVFRLHARPVIVGGYPQFRYGGYSFLMVDPWPAYWGDDWYENDDLYIDYDGDGYYLHNRQYPDVGIAVTVAP